MNYKHLLLAILFLGSTNVAEAQKSALKDKKVALYNYMFALSDEFQFYIEDAVAEDPVSAMDIEDSVSNFFMHEVYNRIEPELASFFECKVLPVDTLEGKLLYDVRGYPAGGKKKAAQSKIAPYYLRLSVQITPRDMIDEELSVNGVAVQQRKIKPHIFIKLIVIDGEGETIIKSKGKSKGDKWVVLDRLTLGGFISVDGEVVEEQQDTLLSALQEAILDLKLNM